jgi:hypothetical protein
MLRLCTNKNEGHSRAIVVAAVDTVAERIKWVRVEHPFIVSVDGNSRSAKRLQHQVDGESGKVEPSDLVAEVGKNETSLSIDRKCDA